MRVPLMIIALITLFTTQVFAGLTVTPTTTLQAETAPNTSAANPPTLNGNIAGANVSKLPTRQMLYPGSTTKIYAAWQGWFGPSNHINVGYNSGDPAQVHRQVEDMISRGIQGAIVDWFGASDPTDVATRLLRQEAEAHPGFEFAVMEDSGALYNAAIHNQCDVTQQLINDLTYIATQYEISPAYTHIAGRPVILMFGVDTFYIDWNRVRAAAPNNPLFFFRGTGGFTENSQSNGAFQWLDIVSPNPFDEAISAQSNFYNVALSTHEPTFGSAYKGFNDTQAIWSTNRYINQHCGQTWVDTFSDINLFFSASNQLPAIQLVTWNDYEEGTAIEPGVDDCVIVIPRINGTALSWDAGGGNENAVAFWRVFISTDGQNLMRLADLPTGTHALDLNAFGLNPGYYIFFVEAVGKPSITNKMSPGITYRTGEQPPIANMTVNLSGPLTYIVSTANSSDPDGAVTGSLIDFGDGTVVSGPTATHTYGAVGSYVITGKVYDNAGASSVARQRVTAKQNATGVTIAAPANGAVYNFPGVFVATANSAAAPITAMALYIDNGLAYLTDRDYIVSPIKLFKGGRLVTVVAWDAAGHVYQSAIAINAEPQDIPATAVLTVHPLPQISPLTVLACTASSFDPDGFILQSIIQFSDGAKAYAFSSAHTFAAPGTYSATGAVIDQFGAGSTAQQTFTVPAR